MKPGHTKLNLVKTEITVFLLYGVTNMDRWDERDRGRKSRDFPVPSLAHPPSQRIYFFKVFLFSYFFKHKEIQQEQLLKIDLLDSDEALY